MGRGGEEDLGFDLTPGRRAPWKRWAEEGRGLTRVLTSPSGGCGENRPWETRVGAGNLGQPTAVVRMGRKEARPGGGGSGGEEVGGFLVNYEDGAHGIHGGGQNWVTGRRWGRLGAGEQKEASGLHTPSAAPTH